MLQLLSFFVLLAYKGGKGMCRVVKVALRPLAADLSLSAALSIHESRLPPSTLLWSAKCSAIKPFSHHLFATSIKQCIDDHGAT